ncbi:MAG: NAD+ synthase [Planctomycetota bacterium]|nr:NAD+ synthase [Planctomycetota bacterium]
MRIALAQLNPLVGDVAGNMNLIKASIDQARADGADLLVTCELALLGYPARDLIFRDGIVEACERAGLELAQYAGDLHVILGHPRICESQRRPFYNSASVLSQGKILATYDKRLMPGYDVFDDDRYFHPGEKTCVIEIAGRKIGLLICEDIWRAGDVAMEQRYDVDPVSETIRDGCDLLVSLNATPFVLGKWTRHRAQIEAISREHKVQVVMVNEVGGYDDLIFDGRSIIFDPGGSMRTVLPGFEVCTKTIDLESTLETTSFPEVQRVESEPMSELYDALVLGVREYAQKTTLTKALLGLSGGIDSALVCVLAASALGPSNVTGIMLPSKFSSVGSLRDAKALSDTLGLGDLHELSIEDLHDTTRGTYRLAGVGGLEGVADENVQARLRGLLLMAISNSTGAMLLATGNKSELAMGYSTLYGDMAGSISVIGDLRKMQVYDLSRWINEQYESLGFSTPPIPEASITKPPSAELKPNQTDQDTLPEYEVLDEIIERYIDREWDAARIIRETGFDESLVTGVTRKIDQFEFKRYQASIILKVSPRTFGRGRPYPLVMKTSTGFEQTKTPTSVSDSEHER